MSLAICTIATDDWIDIHLARWVRYVKKNVHGCRLYLFCMSDNLNGRMPILREFEEVHFESRAKFGREWLNSIRMSATTVFDVPEILYLDCDADVLRDISDLPERYKSDLVCCGSPLIHQSWADVCRELGWPAPCKEMNNGLLYMRRDFGEDYKSAWDKMGEIKGVPDRIRGTMAFNYMIRDMGIDEASYDYGVIWHDVEHAIDARIIQYCNDSGQEKRVHMEKLFRSV